MCPIFLSHRPIVAGTFLLSVITSLATAYEHGICRFCEGQHEQSALHARLARGAELGAPVPAANGKNYAPDRIVDVLNVRIEVTPDFDKRTVRGQTTLTFVPIAQPVRKLTLHARDFKVLGVTGSVSVAEHHTSDRGIEVFFKEEIPAGKQASVTVVHEAEPRDGLYFRTPAQGYKPEDVHLWTQGETHEARNWFPSFDYPNERFTSEVICTVPNDMQVFSNGKLVSEKPTKDGKIVHWKQDKEHVNYLIALAAGRFKMIESKHRDIPLRFITPASQIEHAQNSLKDTADMMAFFERETGALYPWDKYDQVVVDDFNWGGMENTTITILNDSTLHPADTEPTRSSQGLVAHELAHQWFGDYLTCQDWSHLWLNEGFATYYAHLYDLHKNGRDDFLYGLYRDRARIAERKEEIRPIVYRNYKGAYEQFDGRAYGKGSWVLHMLRTQLGDELYRKCIHEYVKRNAQRSVVTQDLQDALERVTGLSLQQFFDQWVYHARHPELTVSQSYDAQAKLAKITVKQTHEVNANVLLFRFPVKLRIRTAEGAIERVIEVSQKEEDFFIPLASKPVVVRFDLDCGVLSDVKFEVPKDMLLAQLREMDDVVGRLLAVDALKKNDDAESVAALKQALITDPFWGVRLEACKALRAIGNPDARAALIASMTQKDARVRRQVVEDLASVFHADARAAVLAVVDAGDPNIDVHAEAIEGLGLFSSEEAAPHLTKALASNSYRQTLMLAAVRAIRRLDDPALIAPLLAALKQREKELRSKDFGDALDALAYIARSQSQRGEMRQQRDEVRTFITGYVNSPKRTVQIRAIKALGTLRDPRAISVLESFAAGGEVEGVQKAAEESLKVLREAKAAPVELKDLRDEFEKLRKSNEDLRKEMQELKKKLEAKSGA